MTLYKELAYTDNIKKELKQVKEHNKLVTKLLLERNSQIATANKLLEDEDLWNWHEPEVRECLRNALKDLPVSDNKKVKQQ
jgi:hypothetical protein